MGVDFGGDSDFLEERAFLFGDETGFNIAGDECRGLTDSFQKFNVGDWPCNLVLAQSGVQLLYSDLTSTALNDEFGNHWVIMRGYLVSGNEAGIDAYGISLSRCL